MTCVSMPETPESADSRYFAARSPWRGGFWVSIPMGLPRPASRPVCAGSLSNPGATGAVALVPVAAFEHSSQACIHSACGTSSPNVQDALPPVRQRWIGLATPNTVRESPLSLVEATGADFGRACCQAAWPGLTFRASAPQWKVEQPHPEAGTLGISSAPNL